MNLSQTSESPTKNLDLVMVLAGPIIGVLALGLNSIAPVSKWTPSELSSAGMSTLVLAVELDAKATCVLVGEGTVAESKTTHSESSRAVTGDEESSFGCEGHTVGSDRRNRWSR